MNEMKDHLTETVIARADLTPPNPAEVGGTGEPDVILLYLDTDNVYRWYHEDDSPTDAEGQTIHSVFAAARVLWPDFELLEYRDQVVESGDEANILDIHAEDERRELGL